MLASLEKFDRLTAVGILARTALAIEDDGNPAGEYKVIDEEKIRESVLFEVYKTLGIDQQNRSNDMLQKIGEMLDNECEKLIGKVDDASTLNELSEKGELPSDLFDVVIINNIVDFHGKKFPNEEKLIKETIVSPDSEQHYGKPANENEPFLISLFAKQFKDKYPLRNFLMLVVGQRQGMVFIVHQAWRVYPDIVNIDGNPSLVEILERFSDVFGAEIEVGEKKGHFILSAEIPRGQTDTTIRILPLASHKNIKNEKHGITITHFSQQNPFGGDLIASLIVAIDLIHYKQVLKSRGW